jgi:hypothetical protein
MVVASVHANARERGKKFKWMVNLRTSVCRRKVVLRDGKIVEDTLDPDPVIAQLRVDQPVREEEVIPRKPTQELPSPKIAQLRVDQPAREEELIPHKPA